MRFAIDSRTGKRVKATREMESAPKGTFLCPNPHCPHKEVFLKGNDLAPSRRGNENEEERVSHVIPHFSHYIAEKLSIKYHDDFSIAHELAITAVQRFLGVTDDDVEVWIAGNLEEETVAPDLIFHANSNTYAIEIQNDLLSVEEFERRQLVYAKHGIIPVWILHRDERTSIEVDGEEINGRYGRFSVGKYLDGFAAEATMTSKFERRLARRQGLVLYYEFPSDLDPDSPRVILRAAKFRRYETKKTKYQLEELYDITTKDEFEYVCYEITKRIITYEELRNSGEFNERRHYAFDEGNELWYVHTIAVKGAESGKDLWFPPNLEIPEYFDTIDILREKAKKGEITGEQLYECILLDKYRWND